MASLIPSKVSFLAAVIMVPLLTFSVLPNTVTSRAESKGTVDSGVPALYTAASAALATQGVARRVGPQEMDSYCGATPPCGSVTYHNGDVMHSANNYMVFWLPSGTNPMTGNAYTYDNPTIDPSATSPSDSSYESLIERYFTDICGSNSLYGMLAQYTDQSGQPGLCSLKGSWTDTASFPSGYGTSSSPLRDSDIQDSATRAQNANHWPTGVNSEYFVFTPYDVYSCFTNNFLFVYFYNGCSFENNPPGVPCYGTCVPFCAYHSYWNDLFRGTTVYANMPDNGTPGGCGVSTSPNNDPFADAEIDSTSHEQFESVDRKSVV